MTPREGRGLWLASGSAYRAGLLGRLGLAFESEAPDVDESPLPDEPPRELARRLAHLKAAAVHAARPDAWVIGSDQVADCAGRILGKPMTLEAARGQLAASSGQVVDFHTAVCLLGPDGLHQAHCDLTRVRFRALSADVIERYLAQEPALDCAGSFKAEGLGITLFEAIESRDPTALVGLPLIALARMLRSAGLELP
ncbi:Maf family protein [Alkalisalibacterium limincola]|uniref:7-methyl-GTP pyrophosphatase n=1 Tax=Alkalisalibacterium limincola TaxID=2699169 RepID=A0A5C8KZ11_9GAMM|nr:nucleoside triphosphate pyrophosphatase [Alkalisalibacterium limincola]TXK66057.1 septum formation inhibitor Maf [Alkalisalibacterium limincola]